MLLSHRSSPWATLSPPPPQKTFAPLVVTLHIIGWQHARLAGSLHGAVHPALVDRLSVDDDVAVTERNLVMVLSCVVVQRPIDALQGKQQSSDTKEKPSRHICFFLAALGVLRPQFGDQWTEEANASLPVSLGEVRVLTEPTGVAACGGEVTDLTEDMLVWCM